MNEVIVTKARVKICRSGRNSWKVAEDTDPPDQIHELEVGLKIQGNKRNGYHLVMSPEGCFTADSWHESKQDALETATEMFGVAEHAWKSTAK